MDNFEFDSSLIEPITNFLDTGISKFIPAVHIIFSVIAFLCLVFILSSITMVILLIHVNVISEVLASDSRLKALEEAEKDKK